VGRYLEMSLLVPGALNGPWSEVPENPEFHEGDIQLTGWWFGT